jgi:hypothetical protein
MGLYNTAGARVTKAGFPAVADNSDPAMVVTADVFFTRTYGPGDKKPEGSIREIAYRSGAKVRQSEINALFPNSTISSVLPATGGVAGGTVVTITGTFLDGASGVTFGGTAGTALTVVSDTQIRVTTPAKAAGAYDVVVADDSGNVTKTAAFTFA